MKSLINRINKEIEKKFEEMGYSKEFAYMSISNRPELADYQINSCFNIAKQNKLKPIDVASDVANNIKNICLNDIKIFSKCEPCNPGFVNLTINDMLLLNEIDYMIKNNNLCIDSLSETAPKCILLDYGGANVAKPLHVGHLRVAVIGEALKRLYNKFNIKTISDVHLGDYGLQMGLVIEQLKDENKTENFTINDLEIIYPKASLRAKGDAKKNIEADIEFNERAHNTTKLLQDDIEPETTIWKKILNISIDDLKKRYAELNVFFDYYYGESTVKNIMDDMVDEMIKNKFAYESNGAFVVDVKEESDKKEMPPCIVRKSDGAVLYATSDIATIKFREENFSADEYVYVVDKRQSLHLEQCFRAAKKCGYVKGNKIFKHIEVGTMNGSDGSPFKSRDGGVVKLETLINEANEKALNLLIDNNKELDKDEANKLSKMIAISALKYGDLSNNPTRDYIFDISKFLSFQGNTGPYILYTLVRIKSILDKINDENFDKIISFDMTSNCIDNTIHDILLNLTRYSLILHNAYNEYDPSNICKYIYEVSNLYNRFYHEHNILSEENNSHKTTYLKISLVVNNILRDAMDILAIDIPEKM